MIQDDFSVDASGNIRHISGITVYTVNEFHAWLQDLADDAAPLGNDLISILTDSDVSALEGLRAIDKPRAMTLLDSFNIDDITARYIKFGSVSQGSGVTSTLYTGLKSIGTPLVALSPIYIVQNGVKLTKYWPDGHIQIMVKAKAANALIDFGDVENYSRKYGQTYAYFKTNLAAGGEQPAAISTAITDWTTLSESAALALSVNVNLSVANTPQTLGTNTGLFKGTITLSGGVTVAEAAQYLQAICRENSVTLIGTTPGWRYRKLDALYDANDAAPFGIVAGGKWFVAKGWWLTGVSPVDSQNYQLTSDEGIVMTAPIVATIEGSNLLAGDTVLIGRNSGSGFLTSEYTLAAATTALGNTCQVNEAIKADTPLTGPIRVNGIRYTYVGYNAGTKTFTIDGTWGVVHSLGVAAWVPFLDLTATGVTHNTTYTSAGPFTARIRVKRGGISPIKPFNTTFAVSNTGGSANVIRTAD